MSFSDINPQIDPASNVGVDHLSSTRLDQHLDQGTPASLVPDQVGRASRVDQTASSTLPDQVGPASRLDQTASSANTNGTTGGAASLQDTAINVKNAAANSATNAINSVKNAQITQDLANGPMATNIKNETSATSNEFSDLAGSRQTPTQTAANDTPLTHYHSFFWTLLSWKNPRATGLTFGATLAFIFVCRYFPLLRYSLKLTWMTLGVVTLAEAAAKFAAGGSVSSSVRPRRYYKIPKETLEATLDDVEQLINFFVIESQRVVFAENVFVTGAAFLATFVSYYLIKLLPLWGMALFGTSVIFLGPLIYVMNKELIDSNLEYAGKVVTEQTQQVREIAGQHTGKALESAKSYAGEYAGAASDLLGKSRQKIPAIPQMNNSVKKEQDFPAAPQTSLPSQTAERTVEIKPEPTIADRVPAY